jgi:hypothetical protein
MYVCIYIYINGVRMSFVMCVYIYKWCKDELRYVCVYIYIYIYIYGVRMSLFMYVLCMCIYIYSVRMSLFMYIYVLYMSYV